MPRCSGVKANGERCERIVGASQTYCYSHDESRAQERSRNASKAASAKARNELSEVKSKLRELMDGVIDGTHERGKVSVAATVAGVLVRYLELERRIKEQDDLEERLRTLERSYGLGEANGRRGATRWG